MSALSSILRSVEGGMVAFQCPGCEMVHAIGVEEGCRGPKWGYNGDPERPTFTPSILARGTEPLSDEEADRVIRGETITPRRWVCHSFVTDGQIRFLDDCTHALAGQTVPIPPFD